MRVRTVFLAVAILLLISETARPNPIVYDVVSEVQVSPVDRIELHWAPGIPFWSEDSTSTPLIMFRIQTQAGHYIITQEGALGDSDYVVIDSSNTEGILGTTGPLVLDDEEDTLRVWYAGYEVTRMVWPSSESSVPPEGNSIARFWKNFPIPPGCGGMFREINFRYIDHTPTFCAPNDDYAGSISGHVIDTTGIPIVGALIKTAYADPLCDYFRYRETRSDSEGAYSFVGLYGRSYCLEASAEGFDPETSCVCVTASENTAGFDFVLSPPGGGVENHPAIRGPERFSLSQNYPNPFNSATEIEYRLPQESRVNLAVYNLLGQKVVTLVNEVQPAGRRTVRWYGRDDGGHEVASGVHLYRLRAGGYEVTKRMVLLR